jgi:hypothetical protein
MQLTARKREILRRVIEEHVATGHGHDLAFGDDQAARAPQQR